MRKLSFVILLAISSLSIKSCRHPILEFNFKPPQWQHGETLNYNIIRNNRPAGKLSYFLYFDMNNEIPVYLVYRITRNDSLIEYFYDSSVVCFARRDFLPLWSANHVDTDFGYYKTEAHYSLPKVRILLETIDGIKLKELEVNEKCYDYNTLFYLVRAIDFSKKHEVRFYLVAPVISEKILYSAHRAGKSKIKINGEFVMCDKIKLTNLYTNDVYYLYYENSEPRRLIGYYDKRINLSFILENSEVNLINP
jgi:hypothetical protein